MLLKKYASPLLACLMVLLFSSCEKESIIPLQDNTPPVELSAADYLRMNANQTVLFHYSVVDEAKSRYYGWIIDEKGDLRKYSVEQLPNNISLSAPITDQASMRSLLGVASEAEYQVDLDELVDLFRQVRHLNLTNIKVETNADASEGVTANFYAYKVDNANPRDMNSGCSSGCGSSCSSENIYERSLVRILLREEGNQIKQNMDSGALKMTDWLSKMKEVN